jgi:hypothetical protein
MPEAKQVLQEASQVPRNATEITPSDWSFYETTKDEKTLMADYQVNTDHAIIQGKPIPVHVPAHETFTTSGNNNSETFNLSHDLIDAPAKADDLVLYSDGNSASAGSIDYANDSFDYKDGGSTEELDVFYLPADQAELTVRLSAPKNHFNEPVRVDAGRANLRDQNREPITFEASPTQPLEGVIPTNYTVEVYLDAPFQFDYTGDQSGATADNLSLHLPVWRAARGVDGLDDVKRDSIR